MTTNKEQGEENSFSNKERLLLHQLRILEWQSDREAKSLAKETNPGDADSIGSGIPDRWELTRGIELYDWQNKCVDRWFRESHRGTIKVVTGGGKTLLALAAAERLQQTEQPDLRLVIVVPTIVLLHQWYEELIEKGNLPASAIGRLGGGYQDDLSGCRILISVLVSASNKLPEFVEAAGVGDRLMLVVDECHRAGASQMSRILECNRAYSLGLSATPERDEDVPGNEDDEGYEDSVVGKALGRIIFELSYADALKFGLIPPFTINHFGLALTAGERQKYDQLSRAISDARSELAAAAPADAASGGAFFRWVRGAAMKRGGEIGGLAAKMTADTSRRKELLYRMDARTEAVIEILKKEFEINPDAQVILFHESIAEAMRLFGRLREGGFAAIAEHSELPDSIRENGLNLFRKGIAQVLVSVKSLIEGFNVPAVDVGIVVASSSSVRQRIQSMGRVMRRHRGAEGEENSSCIYVLYAKETVDDSIYAKLDWERVTGAERNLYFHWMPGQEPVEQSGPPRTPLPGEDQIDEGQLSAGDEYPGEYEGREFTCDNNLNVREPDGAFAKDAAEVAKAVIEAKGQAGKFKITPKKHLVLVRVNRGDEWSTRFVTRLDRELELVNPDETESASEKDVDRWVAGANPGDPYPFVGADLVKEKWKFSQKRGGLITKRISQGEAFARAGDKAQDAKKGADAEALLAAIRELKNSGERIAQLERTESGHVLFRKAGSLHFIYALKKGLEFPK
ncbi:MAG: DEAD/DEAH box helicase [Verrucomicrobiales bacterium]|nr:DEAD/DEAH box helicase [Verrucomicrobiales bacterium]